MAYKDPLKQKQWLEDNKDKIRQQTYDRLQKYRRRNKQFVWELKMNNPCKDCGGFFHPAAMDFDHISDDKVKDVSRLVRDSSLERIKREIEKCDLVCSNCHRIRTYNRNL